MSILSKLKVSSNRRVGVANDPVSRARGKLLAGIEEQKQAIAAEKRGEGFTVTRGKGDKAKEKAFRKWYWRDGNTYHTEVRYGVGAVNLGSGTAIECGAKLDDVARVLDLVAEAVNAGELDKELGAASALRGRRNKEGAEGAAKPTTPRTPKAK